MPWESVALCFRREQRLEQDGSSWTESALELASELVGELDLTRLELGLVQLVLVVDASVLRLQRQLLCRIRIRRNDKQTPRCKPRKLIR